MPATIRLQVDRISADLAAQRLAQHGIPAQVVSDDRGAGLGISGAAFSFSLVIPADREDEARAILAERPQREGGPPRRSRDEARDRRRL